MRTPRFVSAPGAGQGLDARRPHRDLQSSVAVLWAFALVSSDYEACRKGRTKFINPN